MTRLVDGTTPYPWPYDADLSPERCALVVVGWDVHGWRSVSAPEAAVERIERMAALLDAVVVVEPGPDSRPTRLSEPTGDGAPPALTARNAGAVVVPCAGIDAFYGGPLDSVLRRAGRDQILLGGLGLETAVHSTMRSANDRGYECLLVADASAPLAPDIVAASISMVEMSGGIFGAVGATDDVVAALATDHPAAPAAADDDQAAPAADHPGGS